MTNNIYALGLDGGGSHTRAIILNEQGDVMGQGEGGPANYHNIGLAMAQAALTTATEQALQNAHIAVADLSAATWALAGAGRPADQQQYQALAANLLPNIPTTVVPDAEAALMGGLGTQHGIILIAGTGMIAYGKNEQGQAMRAGGWGTHLDQGSGYALGLAILQAVAAAADGSGHPTRLTDRVKLWLDIDDPTQLIPWLYDPRRAPDEIAVLGPLALNEAESDDMIAVEIVAKGAKALAEAVVAVAHRLNPAEKPLPFTYSGGLLARHPFYRQLVFQAIQTRAPHLQAQTPLAEPVMGAAQLALAQLGISHPKATHAATTTPSIWSSEQRNLLTMNLDMRTTLEIVGAMHVADQQAVAAIASQLPIIATVIDQIAARMKQGGRLIYVGAGTSGRLGVLDASECPPTFSTKPEQVVGIIAGGMPALTQSQEGAEDDEAGGAKTIADLGVTELDSIVGIAASGRTPFVVGALAAARQAKALTVALTCNLPAAIAEPAQHVIAPLVGPEVITGSTRLKAGTAQKLVLNMVSTGVMVRLGKTYGNLMVDVQPSNQKLQARAQRIVAQAGEVPEAVAGEKLSQANGEVKTAIAMVLLSCSADEARRRLAEVDGVIRGLV